MKKSFFLFSLAICLVFSACESEYNPKALISLPLKITARLEGADSLFSVEMQEGGCDISFDKSHSLAGTTIHISENESFAKSGDFEREIKSGTFPAQEALIRAIFALDKSEEKGISIENGRKYTIDETVIMVYYDKDSKQLTAIKTEENGRRFDFIIVGCEPL